MKKILTLFLILTSFFSCFCSCLAAAEREKIAIVDVQAILDNSLAMNSVKNAVDTISKKFQHEFSRQENELKDQEKNLLRQKEKLSEEELQKEVLKFNKKVTNIQKTTQDKKLKLEQAHAKAMNKVNEIALKIISDIAAEKKYLIVLPSSQVLFANEKLNITKEVLKRLNSRMPSINLDF